MKRNDLNAIITGIVHRYIEEGWVLEMDNSSYSGVDGVHFLSRGRERVAVGIRRPEFKEVAEDGRFANLRGLDSRICSSAAPRRGPSIGSSRGTSSASACSSRLMMTGTSMMSVRRAWRWESAVRGG